MEVSAGLPFEQMPDLLKLRIIGTTINYILMEEMKGVGFISQESIEELFEKYTSVPLNVSFYTLISDNV
uniref:Uncharacterized protein n=1 Tax=Panagrolaimus superbus TaxID=310955 RepID=A0A914Z7Y9_9BILA